MKKLLIGCGKKPKADFINLDAIKNSCVDVVHDLNVFPYPFEENQFTHIEGEHIIEHLDDIPKVMKELARILEQNGTIRLITPHFASSCAYKDTTHKHNFAYASFKYFEATIINL